MWNERLTEILHPLERYRLVRRTERGWGRLPEGQRPVVPPIPFPLGLEAGTERRVPRGRRRSTCIPPVGRHLSQDLPRALEEIVSLEGFGDQELCCGNGPGRHFKGIRIGDKQ